EIARHGFESVTKQLAGEYDRYHDVAERHGLTISAKRVPQVVEHFDEEPEEVSAWRKILEGTTGALLRQAGSSARPEARGGMRRPAPPSYSALSIASRSRCEANSLRMPMRA